MLILYESVYSWTDLNTIRGKDYNSVGNLIGSLEQVQLNLFDRHIAGNLGISIYQYCMVLFRHEKNGGIHIYF